MKFLDAEFVKRALSTVANDGWEQDGMRETAETFLTV